MRVLFHPDFPKDIQRFEAGYATISTGLATRFRAEVDGAIEAIKVSPTSAGHFLNTCKGTGEAYASHQDAHAATAD